MPASASNTKPSANLTLATALCGGCGGVLMMILDLVGVFNASSLGVMHWLEGAGIIQLSDGEEVLLARPFQWVILLVSSSLVAFFILDSLGRWKHVLVLLCACVLAFSVMFVLALFGVYFYTLPLVLGICFAGGLAMFYVSQHTMRVELYKSAEVSPEPSVKPAKLKKENKPKKMEPEPQKKAPIEVTKEEKSSDVPLPRIRKLEKKTVSSQSKLKK